MHLLLLHTAQQYGNLHVFGCYSHRSQDIFNALRARNVGVEEVFFVYHTDDAVDSVFVNRYTRIAVFEENFFNIFHGGVFVYRHYVYPGYEYVADFAVVEFYRARNKFGFVFIERTVLVGFFNVGQ